MRTASMRCLRAGTHRQATNRVNDYVGYAARSAGILPAVRWAKPPGTAAAAVDDMDQVDYVDQRLLCAPRSMQSIPSMLSIGLPACCPCGPQQRCTQHPFRGACRHPKMRFAPGGGAVRKGQHTLTASYVHLRALLSRLSSLCGPACRQPGLPRLCFWEGLHALALHVWKYS